MYGIDPTNGIASALPANKTTTAIIEMDASLFIVTTEPDFASRRSTVRINGHVWTDNTMVTATFAGYSNTSDTSTTGTSTTAAPISIAQ